MEFKSKQAIYLQIADYVCDHILTKKWPSGEKLPSIKELSIRLEVNPNTVMRTYEYLQQQNIIFNKRGIGYFVDENAAGKILTLRKRNFFESELPEFFYKIELLNIAIEEVTEQYKHFKQSKI